MNRAQKILASAALVLSSTFTACNSTQYGTPPEREQTIASELHTIMNQHEAKYSERETSHIAFNFASTSRLRPDLDQLAESKAILFTVAQNDPEMVVELSRRYDEARSNHNASRIVEEKQAFSIEMKAIKNELKQIAEEYGYVSGTTPTLDVQ